MYYQPNMEIPRLNLVDSRNGIPSYADFKGIVGEININAHFIQHQLNDMLAMMKDIKYHKTMQDNAKKHLMDYEVKKFDVTPAPVPVPQATCEIEPVHMAKPTKTLAKPTKTRETKRVPVRRMTYRDRRNRIGKSSDDRTNESNALEIESTSLQNFQRHPRFLKKWMTDEIYQMIQARQRFSVAVRLHPECKYLKAQLRFYQLAVYDAIDYRKSLFYSRRRNNFRSIRARSLASSGSKSTTGSAVTEVNDSIKVETAVCLSKKALTK